MKLSPKWSLLLLLLMAPTWAFSSLRPMVDQCSLAVNQQSLEQVLPCYLQQRDDAYRYSVEDKSEVPNKKLTVYKLRMTSQRWQPGGEVDSKQVAWKHRVEVYIPHVVNSPTALLYVNGGTLHPENKTPEPNRTEIDFARIASDNQGIVINLQDVPNQHLTFSGASKPLREDDLIAYAWEKFLKDPVQNRYWLPRLPMVKSVIRAMDMVQEFTGEKYDISGFVVSGGSKRGWTAWLAAAMDTRIKAVVPIVIDVLNLRPSMKHHYQAYGFWAPAIRSYERLMPLLDSKGMDDLLEIVDPYSYLKYLAIPKYIVTASADDFFLPDSSRFYFDKLPSQKWMRVLPNERHYVVRSNSQLVTDTLSSFYGVYLQGKEMPELDWEIKGNTLIVTTSKKPDSALLWQANNPGARDFRVQDEPKNYLFSKTPATFSCHGKCQFTLEMPTPKSGWDAYFLELNYANRNLPDVGITTPVIIYPDTYPTSE